MLFDLSKYLLIPILSLWTRIKDLAVFDTACCNEGIRLLFLNLIQLDEFVHRTNNWFHSIDYLLWIK